MGKAKFYAVAIGREGPRIYQTWDECKRNVERYPQARHKSFATMNEATNWLRPFIQPQPTEHVQSSSKAAVSDSDSDVEIVETNLPQHSGTPQVSKRRNDSDSEVEIVNSPPANFPGHNPPLKKARRYPSEEVQFVHPPPTSLPSLPVNGTGENISLSKEQREVLRMVKEGRNVFFTGSAGTGKSVLLREIIRHLNSGSQYSLAITASTGIAAVNIGGTTVHSWAGIGIGMEDAKKVAAKIRKQPVYAKALERWLNVKTLIVDEVSMIDGKLFDKLEEIARLIRKRSEPFGGIQLVLSGDFFQLPPVPGRDSKTNEEIPATFAFNAQSWRRCVYKSVTLSKVFRQKDQIFVDILNAMRIGRLHASTIEAFNKLDRAVKYEDGIEPTEIYSMRWEVDRANSGRLNRLTGDTKTFQAIDNAGVDSNGIRVTEKHRDILLDRLVAAKQVTLKIGAQVMLIKNMQQGHLVNGSVGIVTDFSTSLEAKEKRTEIGLVIDNGNDDTNTGSRLGSRYEGMKFPVVRFANGMTLLCVPHDFTVENANGGMEASRTQIPLILAWALSVHKSQGQTLERVKVDLRKTFEKGQAYVALSRATSMNSLQVVNFDPTKVVVHPDVLKWHSRQSQSYTSPGSPDHDDDNNELDREFAMGAYYSQY